MQKSLKSLLVVFLLAACTPHMEGAGAPHAVADITKDHFLMHDEAKLPLRIWPAKGEKKAILLGVHGFNDYGNFLNPDAPEHFTQNGIELITYDQRGFGQAPHRGMWAGTQTLKNDLAKIIHLIHARNEDLPLFVLGESMGGAIVMNTLASVKPLPVEGIILSAPAVWGMRIWPWYQKAGLYLISHTLPWLKLSGGGIVQPTDHLENWKNWSRDPLVIRGTRVDAIFGVSQAMEAALESAPHIQTPTLVLYGAKDEVIPKNATKAMLGLMQHTPKLAYYPEGWHWLPRDINAPIVWKDIVSWIKARNKALPSQADINAFERLAQSD
ncbi:Lysophospholipase [Candidatus Terasakiella magnetica]|uniref:Lysophospholipase n=1 Tax=Candidatus Terasakiella magnetica TaxID=1867952 RepID=A0A1C3RDT5_9PROT|nr:alpha/beta fold hydrolase [Candidatus Terasakiella magnetica]SCA55457.1 Lysophospholipase [Candidatus Terasakiella magnetica]